jgi:hypothetical protein
MVDQLPMGGIGDLKERRHFLATAPATRREQRIALAIAGSAFVLFVAIVPFVRVPLARMPAFIPSYEAALIFIDLTTATLLFDQFMRLRSASLLALASGYLFDALVIVPHALSFPGAFAATGLLGAKAQTTAWLYVFWHGGFPLFVLAYSYRRRRETANRPLPLVTRPSLALAGAVTAVVLLTVLLTLAATLGHDALPVVMQGSDYSLLVSKGISPAVWALTFLAMIALWQPQQRVVDLWLMLVMWVWLFDIALSAVIGSTRFDLGFYAGRLFGLLAASFLLITLVVEMARMYAGAVSAAAAAERRLSDLAHHRASAEPRPARGEETASFIHRQNIAHYRSLLASGSLDPAQRRSIEALLAEEEARSRPASPNH